MILAVDAGFTACGWAVLRAGGIVAAGCKFPARTGSIPGGAMCKKNPVERELRKAVMCFVEKHGVA